MCIVSCHRAITSYSKMDSAMPARIVTVARSNSIYKGHSRSSALPQQCTVSMSEKMTASGTLPVAVHASNEEAYLRITRKNSFVSTAGCPARVSYVSSRGAGYVRTSEKFFYGRDSGEPLLVNAGEMGNDFEREWEKGGVVKIVEGRGRRA
ncbi:hypothetical protein RUND412_005469 [Rhizina undulata]